jgi:hypothetical protein
MRIRGDRECSDCGHRWSYYETARIACPACGSLRSTGVGDREQHTNMPAEFDLTPARELAGADRWEEAIEAAIECCSDYVRKQGFIHGGDLLALTDTYLAAVELRAVARTYQRVDPGDETTEIYLLALLRGGDVGERPGPEIVTERTSIRAARALAYAKAIREYGREVRTHLDDHPFPEAARTLGSVVEHVKRVQALDGEVDPRTVEHLVCATQAIGRAIREREAGNDESQPALASAREHLAAC